VGIEVLAAKVGQEIGMRARTHFARSSISRAPKPGIVDRLAWAYVCLGVTPMQSALRTSRRLTANRKRCAYRPVFSCRTS
jgi:hypothetical protein